MNAMNDIDPEVAWYYNKGNEAARLETSAQLEAARTRRIITTRMDAGRHSIIDIGGGAGPYALWLAASGHAIHLIDPIPLHIEQAKRAADDAGVHLAGLHVADAEHLPFADESFDVALLMGPLYHLTERERRMSALREACRVLRPGGMIFAATISRYGSVVDGFFKGYVDDPGFAAVMRDVIHNGQHRNPSRHPGFFTTSYFHRPDELRQEVLDAGFVDDEVIAIEGPWRCIPDFDEKWKKEEFRSLLMEVLEMMESDASTIGFGGHLMAIARRPLQTADRNNR